MYFRLGAFADAYALIKTYHYAPLPSDAYDSLVLVATFHLAGGLFGDYGECVAAATFTAPASAWSEPVVVLSRLVRHPDHPVPLSRLIALACAALRRRGEDLVLAYADHGRGHLGYVYQSASWVYAGLRSPSSEGLLIDGRFVPNRTANRLFGTRSPTRLAARLQRAVFVRKDHGKHLYWRALTRRGRHKAIRLHLPRCPYPKGVDAAAGGA